MIQYILILSLMISSSNSLHCFTCGIFLSADEPTCRGEIRNNSCSPENLGCLSIIAPKMDGKFYVEKRCAEKRDLLTEGCIDRTVRGISGKQCLCKTDFCNSSQTIFDFAHFYSILLFSFFVFFY